MTLQSILVSTAMEVPKDMRKIIKFIVTPTFPDSELLSTLQGVFGKQGFQSSSVGFGEPLCPDTLYVSLVEIYQPLIADIQEDEYFNLRSLLSTCKTLVWVTGDPTKEPRMNAINGLLRTVRLEREADNVNLISLALADAMRSDANLAEAISDLISHQCCNSQSHSANSEYMLRDGIFYTNRLLKADGPDGFLGARISNPDPVLTPFEKSGRPVKLSISAPGLLQTLEWITDDLQAEPLPETFIEVEIKSIGLNFRDVMIAMGEYAACDFGGEAAGVVSQVGSKVSRFKPGDRVVYLGGLGSGCFQTYGRVDEAFAVHLPGNLDFSIAAGIPCVWVTVLYALQEIARLSEGETILIHAAAGGVGQAAIQYAKMIGAKIYATVSTPEKRQVLISQYGIPRNHIFSSRDLTFSDGLMRATDGRGVDVILNSLSGDALRKSWECIAPLGRFIELGRKDAQDFGHVELTPFLQNVTLASVQIPIVMTHQHSLIGKLLQDAMRLFIQGNIRAAQPTTVMKYSEIEKALRQLQSGSGIGKIVLSSKEDDPIPIVPGLFPSYQFNPEASYVLAGGLGGIGRSIARWMAAHGAKHLVFLSRSGHSESKDIRDLIKDLQQSSCEATIISCDISSKTSLQQVIGSRLNLCPPIKGCIQCAMVLKASLQLLLV
jgi:NADPH:quinone reductase-like Zn-dependent oxidoreductase